MIWYQQLSVTITIPFAAFFSIYVSPTFEPTMDPTIDPTENPTFVGDFECNRVLDGDNGLVRLSWDFPFEDETGQTLLRLRMSLRSVITSFYII